LAVSKIPDAMPLSSPETSATASRVVTMKIRHIVVPSTISGSITSVR
jgi:hypothetical protein